MWIKFKKRLKYQMCQLNNFKTQIIRVKQEVDLNNKVNMTKEYQKLSKKRQIWKDLLQTMADVQNALWSLHANILIQLKHSIVLCQPKKSIHHKLTRILNFTQTKNFLQHLWLKPRANSQSSKKVMVFQFNQRKLCLKEAKVVYFNPQPNKSCKDHLVFKSNFICKNNNLKSNHIINNNHCRKILMSIYLKRS